MVGWPCCSCWASPVPEKETRSVGFFEETRTYNIPREKEIKPAASRGGDVWRTALSDVDNDSGYAYPKRLIGSDVLSNETEEPKIRPPKLPTESTSSILLSEKIPIAPEKHFKRRSYQPGSRISGPSLTKLHAAGVSEIGDRLRQQTYISDWDGAYEDGADLRVSNFQSSNLKRVVDNSIWSDSVTPRNSSIVKLDSGLILPKCQSSPLKMPVRPGMVMAMHRTKDGQRLEEVSLNSSLREIVDTFLRIGDGPSLPVSFSYSNKSRPQVLTESRMGMSLADNLRGYLDAKTQGISFFVGSVNTKLCYKMSVCELSQLQKIAQVFPKQCV